MNNMVHMCQLHAKIHIHGNGVHLLHVIRSRHAIKIRIKFTVTEVANMCVMENSCYGNFTDLVNCLKYTQNPFKNC